MIKLHLSYNMIIAIEALKQNKFRSLLTSLGIIFGTASVIAMMAIAGGAEAEILEKMSILGTNNIIIKVKEKVKKGEENNNESNDAEANSQKYSKGLSIADAESIVDIIPGIQLACPVISKPKNAIYSTRDYNINLISITDDYFNINKINLAEGRLFSTFDYDHALPVCIIGSNISKYLLTGTAPIGQKIKCGKQWLTVIGVVSDRGFSEAGISSLGLRQFDDDIYLPITSYQLRYNNPNLITRNQIGGRRNQETNEELLNEVNKIIVRVKDTKKIKVTADVISTMLSRRHNQVDDFEVIVPELLLQQEKDTRRIFNIVLSIIASISLLVGGIGIMNIMLASVLERTKEIGIRMAIGAYRSDILEQFLFEAAFLSLVGGIIGILLGVGGAIAIRYIADIKTVLTWGAPILSFFVSISIGIVFGYLPARKASTQIIIDLLRYE